MSLVIAEGSLQIPAELEHFTGCPVSPSQLMRSGALSITPGPPCSAVHRCSLHSWESVCSHPQEEGEPQIIATTSKNLVEENRSGDVRVSEDGDLLTLLSLWAGGQGARDRLCPLHSWHIVCSFMESSHRHWTWARPACEHMVLHVMCP